MMLPVDSSINLPKVGDNLRSAITESLGILLISRDSEKILCLIRISACCSVRMSSSLSEIIGRYKDMLLLLQLTPLQRRQIDEALSRAQDDLHNFQQLSEDQRDECLEIARSRETEIIEKWRSLFGTFSDTIFCLSHLRKFEKFLINAVEHDHYEKPLLEHQHVLNVARIKGVEAERHLAADFLTRGNIAVIDELYEKIVTLITTELEISRLYLESRMTAFRNRRGSEHSHIWNLVQDVRLEELATITSGDKRVVLLFHQPGSRWSDLSTEEFLRDILKLHNLVFTSSMEDPNISLTTDARRFAEQSLRRTGNSFNDNFQSSNDHSDSVSPVAGNLPEQSMGAAATSALDILRGSIFNRNQAENKS